MATAWVVTSAADRVTLDDAARGEITFTVTNPGTHPDRAVFEVVPGEGADRSWFTVDEPQRRVAGNGSVSYLVHVALPPGTPPGSYVVQGRVYSADSAPEEDSVLSGRLAVEKKAAPVPVAKRRPWWLLAVAGLVAVVLGVVGWLVFGTGGGKPAPAPTTELVAVPDLTNWTLGQATTNLGVAGLKVGTVRHKQDPAPDKILFQSVPPGSKAPKGSAVDLVVTVNLSPPTLLAPSNGSDVPKTAFAAPITPVPTQSSGVVNGSKAIPTTEGVFRWSQTEKYPTRWRVTVQQVVCFVFGAGTQSGCDFINPVIIDVDAMSVTPQLSYVPPLVKGRDGFYDQGYTTWDVVTLDDFGNPGRASQRFYFTAK